MATQKEKIIIDSIQRIAAKAPQRPQIVSGVVRVVDESLMGCTVEITEDDGGGSSEVMLNARLQNDNGLLQVPAVGSIVWLAEIDGRDKLGVIKCSNLDKVIARVGENRTEFQMVNGTVTVKPEGGDDVVLKFTQNELSLALGGTQVEVSVKSGQITLNGGENGGMVKVGELTQKLNRLETAFNAHVAVFNSHIHLVAGAVQASPPAPVITATVSVPDTNTITPVTSVNDLKNDNVKH